MFCLVGHLTQPLWLQSLPFGQVENLLLLGKFFLGVFNFTHHLAHSVSHERNLKLNMRSLYGNFVIRYKTSLIVFDSYYCYAKWYSSIVKREYE